ncbi:hypothetical protein LRS13_16175 [Svornostia abyssi]|uniref:Uncharacterized protein n=1 Tax=Svornostia abyssi TaxID=2898438 RepID=A0ABY5PCA6_9ACTN|nr:hypothetical protein LRS13_16175 [Parviterribacteraceae bacterium J379]
MSQVYPVTVDGQWVLIWRDDDHAALHRCGRRAPEVLPKGFTTSTLGQGWVAQAREVKNSGWSIDLLRLSDRRRFVARSVSRDLRNRPHLVITKGRLYVRDHGGMLVSVRLPKG